MQKTLKTANVVNKNIHFTEPSCKKRLSHAHTAGCVIMLCCLQELSLRVTVAETTDDSRGENLGHVIIGPEASGMGITHWNQMLATLRKPVSMWHPLRRI